MAGLSVPVQNLEPALIHQCRLLYLNRHWCCGPARENSAVHVICASWKPSTGTDSALYICYPRPLHSVSCGGTTPQCFQRRKNREVLCSCSFWSERGWFFLLYLVRAIWSSKVSIVMHIYGFMVGLVEYNVVSLEIVIDCIMYFNSLLAMLHSHL